MLRIRPWTPRPIPLKPFYTAAELGRAMGLTRHIVRKLLRMQQLSVYQLGTTLLVPLPEIRDKLPDVFEAIEVACACASEMKTKVDLSKKTQKT